MERNGACSFLPCLLSRPPCYSPSLASFLRCLSQQDGIWLTPGSFEPFLLAIRSLGESRLLDMAHPAFV